MRTKEEEEDGITVTGKLCNLSEFHRDRYRDHCIPFVGLFGFDNVTTDYNGTIFRFPFRNPEQKFKSKLIQDVSKFFNPEVLKEDIFEKLKNEAPYILLFLKHVASIELFTFDEASNKMQLYFRVAFSKDCMRKLKELRQDCQDRCNQRESFVNMGIPIVEIFDPTVGDQPQQQAWLLANCVSSSDPTILRLAEKLKVLPWAGLAAPLPCPIEMPNQSFVNLVRDGVTGKEIIKVLSKYFRNLAHRVTVPLQALKSNEGYAFCFLPLQEPTGLPVHVHGYFRVSSNRRSIEWPSHNDTGEQATWNKHLVESLIIPLYAILLATKPFLCSYVGELEEVKALTDPYSWWPPSYIGEKSVWGHILKHSPGLPNLVRKMPVFWSPRNGGEWVKASETLLIPKECPSSIAKMLVKLNAPVTILPEQILKCFKDDLFRYVTPEYVCQLLRSRSTRDAARALLRDTELLEALLLYIFNMPTDSLVNLPIVPLNADLEPVDLMLSHLNSDNVYIVDDELTYNILPGLDNLILSRSLSEKAKRLFKRLASYKAFCLIDTDNDPDIVCSKLLIKSIQTWIPNYSHFSSTYVWYPGEGNMPSSSWLSDLWEWFHRTGISLAMVEGLPIIPSLDVTQYDDPPETTLYLLTRGKPYLRCGTSTADINEIATALGCTLIPNCEMYSTHELALQEFVPSMTPKALLSALSIQASITPLPMQALNHDQICTLRSYLLSDIPKHKRGRKFLASLPIYSMGVGSTTLKFAPLTSQFIFPPYAISFPGDLCFPQNILNVKVSEGHLFETLLGRGPHPLFELVKYVVTGLPKAHPQRNVIFIWILKLFKTNEYDIELSNYLKSLKFLPSTKGTINLVGALFDPEDNILVKMFSDDEPVFPHGDFSKTLLELRMLGLNTWQSIKDNPSLLKRFLLNRAKAVFSLPRDKAMFCSTLILRKLCQNYQFVSDFRNIPFVLSECKPPIEYPPNLLWHGREDFMSPSEICVANDPKVLSYLVGSSQTVISSSNYDASLLTQVEGLKGLFRPIKWNDVCQHLMNIIDLDHRTIHEHREVISAMVMATYQFFSRTQRTLQDQALPDYIWHDDLGVFLEKDKLAIKPIEGLSLIPFRYALTEIPRILKYKNFLKSMNFYKQFSIVDCVEVLVEIDDGTDDHTTTVINILKYFERVSFNGKGVLIPTNDSRLLPPDECTYDDRGLTDSGTFSLSGEDEEEEDEVVFTHADVTKDMARFFKVVPLTGRIGRPRGLAIAYDQKGQNISLTTRIKSIIRNYGQHIDVFKELIQNADDAGATEVKFLIDWRSHPTITLFKAEMKQWQGPALYAYNDAVFQKQDFDNICKVEGGTKSNDPTKIGRFGLGFCSTYHLTDVPSFVSGNTLMVFDPHGTNLGDAITNNNPGVSFNFVREQRKLKRYYSDQLLPYQDVFGCNVLQEPVEEYNHTLFRFPLRRALDKMCEICDEIFDSNTMEMWKEDFMKTADVLLVFLRNVRSIEMYELQEDERLDNMVPVVKVLRKDLNTGPDLLHYYLNPSFQLRHNEGVCSFSISCQLGARYTNQDWLVSSALGIGASLQAVRQYPSQKVVPLGEVAIKVKSGNDDYITPLQCSTGRVFCFLPLPKSFKQPCLINGYFEVSDDRNELKHLSDESNLECWNRYLITDALARAYIHLLQHLSKEIDPSDSECLTSFYRMWPVFDNGDDISRVLSGAFLQMIVSDEAELFYSSKGWQGCNDICILNEVDFQKIYPLKESILTILADYGTLNVALNVPSEITQHHILGITQISVEDFFIDYLFQFKDEIDKQSYNNLIKFALQHYELLDGGREWLKYLLADNECIPTEPNGTLKRPCDLVNPEGPLGCLYDLDEERFPIKELVCEEKLVKTLTQMMMKDLLLNDNDVLDRAEVITEMVDCETAKRRSLDLLNYLAQHRPFIPALQEVSFIPVMDIPSTIDLPWHKEIQFASSKSLYHRKCKELVFSVAAIAHEDVPSECLDHCFLGFKTENQLEIELVVEHLLKISYYTRELGCKSDKTKDFITKCIKEIYHFADQYFKTHFLLAENYSMDWKLVRLVNANPLVVWDENEGLFRSFHILAMQACDIPLAPYRLSSTDMPILKSYKFFWKALGIKQSFAFRDFTDVLQEISDSSHIDISKVCSILQYLYGKCRDYVLLPDTNGKLLPPNKCFYDDRRWTERKQGDKLKEKYPLVHPTLGNELANYFGASALSERIANPVRLKFENRGQELPIPRRLNRILDQYSTIKDIFKELIQNADDAGAKEVKFLIDKTSFPSETLFTEVMKSWQGPALYAFNDATFSDQDFENIYQLEGATKKEDPSKIGRFGIGFCSVFHLTDVPSFVSRNKIVFLDPLRKNLINECSGIRFNFVDELEEITDCYKDQVSPYNIFGCDVLSGKEFHGTLFRFPFRRGGSEICQKPVDIESLKYTLNELAEMLPVFLQNVQVIELYERQLNQVEAVKLLSIKRNKSRKQNPLEVWKESLDSSYMYKQEAMSFVDTFNVIVQSRTENQSSQSKKEKGKKSKSVASYKENETNFIVASSLAGSDTDSWKFAQSREGLQLGLVPLAEIALPVDYHNIPKRISGRLFCFLPLPISIDLKCLVNGYFELSDNRRELKDIQEKQRRDTWNHMLARDAVTEAFLELLSYITSLERDESQRDNFLEKYYTLWPVGYSSHPFTKEVRFAFMKALSVSNRKLVWSLADGGRWVTVNEAYCLDDELCGDIYKDFRNDMLQILIQYGYSMVEIPQTIRSHLFGSSRPVLKGISLEDYCKKVLLPNLSNLSHHIIVKQMLFLLTRTSPTSMSGSTTKEKSEHWLRTLLKETPCIPTLPHNQLVKPDHLVNPTTLLGKLYFEEEARFPVADFLEESTLSLLTSLGMASYTLKDDDVLDRANSISSLQDPPKALERSRVLVKYLVDKYATTHKTSYFSSFVNYFTPTSMNMAMFESLKSTLFLPVLQKPSDVSLPWYGHCTPFACANDMYMSHNKVKVFAIGLVLDQDATAQGIDNLFTFKSPTKEDSLEQYNRLVTWAEKGNLEPNDSDQALISECIPVLCSTLSNILKPNNPLLQSVLLMTPDSKNEEFRISIRSTLQNRPCIWQKSNDVYRFHTPDQIVDEASMVDQYPYLVKLSSDLTAHKDLMKLLGVRPLSLTTIADTLGRIKCDYGKNSVKNLIDFIASLARLTYTPFSVGSMPLFYLPDEHLAMQEATDLAFKDLDDKSSFVPPALLKSVKGYVHHSLPKWYAKRMGVQDLLPSIVSQFQDQNFMSDDEFGQHEEIGTRLNNILSQYPADECIFKEFMQNAEDAKATEIAFVIDERTFKDHSLFGGDFKWKSLQRLPSLIVYNNRKFEDKDFKGIARLGLGSKGGTGGEIGRFGIGFNVAYHVTDCPTFVSFGEGGVPENFCALDPNKDYVPYGSKRRLPGARYKMEAGGGKHVSDHFPDQFAPFKALDEVIPRMAPEKGQHYKDFHNNWPNGYTVFRFPLTRHSLSETNRWKTKLEKGYHMNVPFLSTLLNNFMKHAADMLLFLNNLERISVFRIGKDGNLCDYQSVTAKYDDVALQCRLTFSDAVHRAVKELNTQKDEADLPTSTQVSYKLSLCKGSECTNWIVSKRCGTTDLPKDLLFKASSQQLYPFSGVAVPVPPEKNETGEGSIQAAFTGHLYSYLPLPLSSGLPLHVNAHFWVDQSRKHLESAASGEDKTLGSWNESIVQNVVSKAYMELIILCKNEVDKCINFQKWFYKLFPVVEFESILGKFELHKRVYLLLLENNADILLADKSTISWYSLTCDESRPTKGWFPPYSGEVSKVLMCLGMNITKAPFELLLNVSKTLKPEMFCGEVTPGLARKQLFSCQMSPTYRSVVAEQIVSLLHFVLTDITESNVHIIEGMLLLLNWENKLTPIRANHPLFLHDYKALLPSKTHNRFVSEVLTSDESIKDKLCSLKIVIPLTAEFVAQHIQLPRGSVIQDQNDLAIGLLKKLWKFILFNHQHSIPECFNSIPLISTNQSTLVPLQMAKSVLREYNPSVPYFEELKLPKVDFSQVIPSQLIPHAVNLTRDALAVENDPENVLNVLAKCIHMRQPNHPKSSKDALSFVSFIASKVNVVPQHRSLLRKLKIFQSFDEKWTSLDMVQSAIPLPSHNIPKDGLQNLHASPVLAILSVIPMHLALFYKSVGITVVETEVEFYNLVIVPSFHHMQHEDQIKHLQFISKNQERYLQVIKNLSKRNFIDDTSKGQKQKVSDYFDHRMPLLQAFLPENSFLPNVWRSNIQLLESLDLGIKTEVSNVMWGEFARKITFLPAEVAQKRSELLLEDLSQRIMRTCRQKTTYSNFYIMSEHTGTDSSSLWELLSLIANIPFVPASKIRLEQDELFFKLVPPLSEPQNNMKAFFSFSEIVLCNESDVNLVRFVSPVITFETLTGLRESSFSKEDIKHVQENLKLKQITIPLVCQNLLKLSELTLKWHPMSSKRSHSTIGFLKGLFLQQYVFLASNIKNKDSDAYKVVNILLNQKQCIFLTDHLHSTYSIVQGDSLVHHYIGSLFAHIGCVPPYLSDQLYVTFLHALGVQDKLNICHLIELLKKCFNSQQRSCNPDDPNSKEIHKKLYHELVSQLRQDSEACKQISRSQDPLPLPDKTLQLMPATDLVLNDATWYQTRLMQCSAYKFVSRPPPRNDGQVTLPSCLKVQCLSELVVELLDPETLNSYNRCEADLRREQLDTDDSASLGGCEYCDTFIQLIESEKFANGLRRIIHHKNPGKPISQAHEDCIQRIQDLNVKCVKAIQTFLQHKSSGKIPHSTDSKVPCYLDKTREPHTLYVVFHPATVTTEYEQLLSQIVYCFDKVLMDVDKHCLQDILNGQDPDKIDVILDRMKITPFDPANQTEGDLPEGKVTDLKNDLELLLMYNFEKGDLVKFCAPDLITARVLEVKEENLERDYPFPPTLKLKVDPEGADDEETLHMNSLLVSKFLGPQQIKSLESFFGLEKSSDPSSGAIDLARPRDILLELPCDEQDLLSPYLQELFKAIGHFSSKQMYFAIERVLFQIHFDCVHRHKDMNLFQSSIVKLLTFVEEILELNNEEDNTQFLHSLQRKIEIICNPPPSEARELESDEYYDAEEIVSEPSNQQWTGTRYTSLSSWQPVTANVVPGPAYTSSGNPGFAYHGVPQYTPTNQPAIRRSRGRRTSNFPGNPAARRFVGGRINIFQAHPRQQPSIYPQREELPPEPPPVVSKEDAYAWLLQASDDLDKAQHLIKQTREVAVLKEDNTEQRKLMCRFPDAVCLFAHDIVLKCLKALFFAYFGLRHELAESNDCNKLYEQLKSHPNRSSHPELNRIVSHIGVNVNLVQGHGDCCRFPSSDGLEIPCQSHSPIIAEEMLSVAVEFIKKLKDLEEFRQYFPDDSLHVSRTWTPAISNRGNDTYVASSII